MVNVKNNYRDKYKNNNLHCPLCGETTSEIDSQRHLLLCEKLNAGKPSQDGSQYDYIFSFNLEKMKEVVLEFERALVLRDSLLETSPSPSQPKSRKS